MTLDMSSYSFWIVGIIWFTVPILSWLWSMASIFYYRKATSLMKAITSTLEQSKTLNEQMLSFRLETMEIRSKAEEEFKLACNYYTKVCELLSKENNN